MALPVTVPNTFAGATASIPLSQLDTNFSTLANAVNGIADGSESLANVSISGGSVVNVSITNSTLDNVSIGTTTANTASFTEVTLNAQGDLKFADSDSSHYVAFQAPATVASNVTWTLPSADGTSGQLLSTDGSGALAWASGGGSLTGTTDSVSPFLTAVGSGAGAVTTGANNTALGYLALTANTTGANNTAVGYASLDANTTGIYNTAVGSVSLTSNETGSYNTAVGVSALNGNTTGSNNGAFGSDTGGYSPLWSNTTGSNNNAFGNASLSRNTTGSNNTAVGHQALLLNTTGTNNTAVGSGALDAATSSDNCGFGFGSLGANTTGRYNTAVGTGSAPAVTTGTDVVAFGFNAGNTITTGSYGVYIGSGATASAAGASGEIVICHYQKTGKGNNTGFINPGDGGVYQGNNSSSWSTTSDQRLKKNIVDNTEGLEKINALRVRNFEYRLPEEVTELPEHTAINKEGVQLGVIAQEIQQVCPDCVKEETTGVLSVDSDNVFWHMVNAIKELSAKCDSLQAEINTLKGQ
jgi:trimeric autotransporter adhesin